MSPHGLLLFAHGARDARWAEPFEAVAARLRALAPAERVMLAYLEFMSPGLVEAGSALVAQGCTAVTVVPLFLGAGGHVRKDVPALLDELRRRHPAIAWRLQETIGVHPLMIEAMAQAALSRVDEAKPT